MKLKTKQCLRTKGLTKGGDILACNLFTYLPRSCVILPPLLWKG